MYFKIRKIGASPDEEDLILTISKTAKIEEIRKAVEERFGVEPSKQLLLYKGKQLVDDHRIVDYDIQLNDVVQLMVRNNIVREKTPENSTNATSNDETTDDVEPEKVEDEPTVEVPAESSFYKINDLVDYIDAEYGSWCEARITEILKNSRQGQDDTDDKNLTFKLKFETDLEHDPLPVRFDEIRPRARYTYKKSELQPDMLVMVNYNIEEPKTRGHWYDFKISKVTDKTIVGTVLVGKDKTPLEDCTVKFVNEVMRIEPPQLMCERDESDEQVAKPRKNPYRCNTCKDVKSRKCKSCGCQVCHGKHNPETMILCDECDLGYHLACLVPPLTEVPSDPEWFCPSCKIDENEIVKAGDKLKFSNKKAKMASSKSDGNARDWGRGMACVGRTTQCTIVPKDHYGAIPGVEVGTCWKFRLQVSEAGVHRPHVAGIHGRESDGAYSLILSGGYEDDVDYGHEFYYTGSGGRDLSGNKRISEQSCDQTLTRMNKALAMNCNAPFNDKVGAKAKEWNAGKPVRVVRNYKLAKHSKFAPKDGNRYDGLYKVVKYYPEKGKSGFLVWRYLLRRDDPSPAPWEKGGQELDMLYPPGYLEAQAEKEKKPNGKRALSDSSNLPEGKKPKLVLFELHENLQKAIKKDEENEKLWTECKEMVKDGKQAFLAKVEEIFMCICCREVVFTPVTTPCKHNMCKTCLKRSFSSEIYCCPCCRFDLTKSFKLVVNEALSEALHELFPGYGSGR